MRILHISSAKTWRGGEQQLAYLVHELQKKRIYQKILCVKNSSMDSYCQQHQMAHFTYKKSSSINPLTGKKIAKLCQNENFDLVHMHDAHAHTFGYLSAILFGNKTPFVLSRRVDFSIKNSFLSLKKYNHPNIKKILCVSDAIRQIASSAIKDKNKLEVVYSGIDLSRFPYSNTNILRKEFQIPTDIPIIGNVAAIAPHKDYFTFVKTAKHLLEQGQKAHFFIIGGDGGEQEKIQHFIQEEGLEKHITLTGFREDIPKILPELDVFLITSKTEGLGTSILDAFACQVPVVATEAGGIPELVLHERTGLLAPIEDTKILGQHLIQLLQNSSLRQTIISGANQHLGQFTTAKTAERTLAVYQKLVETSAQ